MHQKLTSPAHADGMRFIKALEETQPFFATSVRKCVERHPDETLWVLNPLAEWSEKAFGETIYHQAAEGYCLYSKDVAYLQRLYEKDGIFNHDDMSNIKAHVYEDPAYMIPYMWAAILIYPFWPGMIRHIAIYRDEFLKKLSKDANVLELGCGHGMLGLLAAKERSDISVESCDLSSHAIDIAQKLLAVTGFENRVTQKVQDVLDISNDSSVRYKGIIAAMLAEHLQEPLCLFKSVAHYLDKDGICFFSTALESAQKDHVFEFHRESEVVKMAEEAGLRASFMVSDGQTRMAYQKFRPRALAMILEHA